MIELDLLRPRFVQDVMDPLLRVVQLVQSQTKLKRYENMVHKVWCRLSRIVLHLKLPQITFSEVTTSWVDSFGCSIGVDDSAESASTSFSPICNNCSAKDGPSGCGDCGSGGIW